MNIKLTSFLLLLFFITISVFSQVKTASLVAYYPFKGNANDETGNGHNGTVSGATLTTDRFNVPNNAYLFDGINDFIRVQNANVFNFTGSSFSMSVWAYLIQTGTEMSSCMIAKRDGVGTGSGFIFHITGQTAPMGFPKAMFQTGTGTDPNIYYNNFITLSAWHHIAVTFDNAIQEIKLYVDGTLHVTSYVVPHYTSNNSFMTFGHDSIALSQGINYTFNGKLDDIGFYDGVITQSEIDSIYQVSINENSSYSEMVTINAFAFENSLIINGDFHINADNTTLEVTNLLGQTLYSKDYVIENNKFSEKIDISNYMNGIYLVRLRCGTNYIVKKMVINK